nr:MAG TPA: hypothetical protein [Caudoviricetes sp.]
MPNNSELQKEKLFTFANLERPSWTNQGLPNLVKVDQDYGKFTTSIKKAFSEI